MHSIGLILAFVSVASFTFGDFFIQKDARLFGSWRSLVYICVVTFPLLLPFVWRDLLGLDLTNYFLLLFLSIVTIFAAIFDFEALRLGKISVIEPIMGMEVPFTAAFSLIFWHEHLNLIQGLLVVSAFMGVMLAATKNTNIFRGRKILEKGAVLAGLGAITMALTNFLTGAASQQTSPLLAIWFMNLVVGLVSLFAVIRKGEVDSMFKDIRRHPFLIGIMSVLDNVAWIAYAYAMVYIPITIATTITESYIVFTSLLGIWFNKERLRRHQFAGIVITIVSILILSAIT